MHGGGCFKTSGADIRSKVASISANSGKYPVSAMCGVLGVPRSTYYWAISHPEPGRADDPIAGDVVRIYEDNRREYGAPKIKRALAREGIVASRRRIKRIMNQKGLVSAYTRKKYKPRAAKASEAGAPNVLDREFDGYPAHTHIVSDLTYVRVGNKWNYVCLLIDLYNREIVGHAAGGRRDSRLVKAAFATLGFPLTDIEVFHTDRGSGFANSDIDDLLKAFDIRRSLSRRGDPYDNAVIESTNRILKKELVYRRAFTDLGQLRRELNSYVRWYNEERIHSTLGYMSPVEFRNAGLSL